MTGSGTSIAMPEFSLVKGGLIYRIFRRAGLCDENLEPINRRVVVVAAIAWLPLLVLSTFDGRVRGGVDIPFLSDIENHVRFLVALPFLLAAETLIQRLLSPRIKNFVTRNIVREADMPKFRAAIESAGKMRDSIVIELAIVVVVYAVGAYFYGGVLASASNLSPTWYASPDGTHWNLTLAGYWLVIVSLPIFQIMIVRWYYRIFIWFVFLLRVSRLDLFLLPTHSDRSAGLGFLNKCAYSFAYGLLAQGALLSGYIAGQVMHFGGDPRAYKLEAAGLVFFALVSVLGPLAFFAPKLITAKWERGGDFSNLSSRFVRSFNSKWIVGAPPEDDTLLGTNDFQSLADLGNSFSVIDQTKTVPFSVADAFYLALVTLMPLLPLLLFIFSLEELLDRIVKVLM